MKEGGEGREPSGQCDYRAPCMMGWSFRSIGKRTPHPQWINLINNFLKVRSSLLYKKIYFCNRVSLNSKKIKFRFLKCDLHTIFQKYKYYLNWGTPADKCSHSFLYKILYLTSVNRQLRERLKMVKFTAFQCQVPCGNSCLIWSLHLLKEMRA